MRLFCVEQLKKVIYVTLVVTQMLGYMFRFLIHSKHDAANDDLKKVE